MAPTSSCYTILPANQVMASGPMEGVILVGDKLNGATNGKGDSLADISNRLTERRRLQGWFYTVFVTGLVIPDE